MLFKEALTKVIYILYKESQKFCPEGLILDVFRSVLFYLTVPKELR